LQTPTIALTAYATPADRTAALAKGFQTHLPKPFEPNDLIDAVARLSTGNFQNE
jgi:CheY-like chemotaxis protein